MVELILVLVIVSAVVFGLVAGAAVSLVWYLLTGLVVGAVARALVSQTRDMGLLVTALYGVAGSMVGGILGHSFIRGTISELVVSVLGAALLLAIFGRRK